MTQVAHKPPMLTLSTQQLHRTTAATETKIKVERLKSIDPSSTKKESNQETK